MANQFAHASIISTNIIATKMANESRTCFLGKSSRSTQNEVRQQNHSQSIISHSFLSIIMRVAEVQLTVQHQLPVLLYEAYPIKIQIKNRENIDIHSAM